MRCVNFGRGLGAKKKKDTLVLNIYMGTRGLRAAVPLVTQQALMTTWLGSKPQFAVIATLPILATFLLARDAAAGALALERFALVVGWSSLHGCLHGGWVNAQHECPHTPINEPRNAHLGLGIRLLLHYTLFVCCHLGHLDGRWVDTHCRVAATRPTTAAISAAFTSSPTMRLSMKCVLRPGRTDLHHLL